MKRELQRIGLAILIALFLVALLSLINNAIAAEIVYTSPDKDTIVVVDQREAVVLLNIRGGAFLKEYSPDTTTYVRKEAEKKCRCWVEDDGWVFHGKRWDSIPGLKCVVWEQKPTHYFVDTEARHLQPEVYD